MHGSEPVLTRPGGAQVVITHARVRADAGHFNDCLSGAVFEEVAIHDDGPFHLAEKAGHLGEKVREGEADRGMHGVNIVGFDGGLGGRTRAERQADEDKGEYGTFHDRFLSGLTDDRRLSVVCWHSRKSYSEVANVSQAAGCRFSLGKSAPRETASHAANSLRSSSSFVVAPL